MKRVLFVAAVCLLACSACEKPDEKAAAAAPTAAESADVAADAAASASDVPVPAENAGPPSKMTGGLDRSRPVGDVTMADGTAPPPPPKK